jgi:hypothetical protein
MNVTQFIQALTASAGREFGWVGYATTARWRNSDGKWSIDDGKLWSVRFNDVTVIVNDGIANTSDNCLQVDLVGGWASDQKKLAEIIDEILSPKMKGVTP